jgi:hypothetical protein
MVERAGRRMRIKHGRRAATNELDALDHRTDAHEGVRVHEPHLRLVVHGQAVLQQRNELEAAIRRQAAQEEIARRLASVAIGEDAWHVRVQRHRRGRLDVGNLIGIQCGDAVRRFELRVLHRRASDNHRFERQRVVGAVLLRGVWGNGCLLSEHPRRGQANGQREAVCIEGTE